MFVIEVTFSPAVVRCYAFSSKKKADRFIAKMQACGHKTRPVFVKGLSKTLSVCY